MESAEQYTLQSLPLLPFYFNHFSQLKNEFLLMLVSRQKRWHFLKILITRHVSESLHYIPKSIRTRTNGTKLKMLTRHFTSRFLFLFLFLPSLMPILWMSLNWTQLGIIISFYGRQTQVAFDWHNGAFNFLRCCTVLYSWHTV